MSTQPFMQQVRWQDLKVKSEVDIILEIADQDGWDDCEIFGYGDMITEPQESMGWKLIPADLYEYSIPVEGVERLRRIINAGVQIQGVIIADDERITEPQPASARPEVSLLSIETIMSFVSKALIVFICTAGAIAISVIALIPLAILGLFMGPGMSVDYDPKLVVLVDDGKGGTVWVSLFTWYE
jgi:hypothetical protein